MKNIEIVKYVIENDFVFNIKGKGKISKKIDVDGKRKVFYYDSKPLFWKKDKILYYNIDSYDKKVAKFQKQIFQDVFKKQNLFFSKGVTQDLDKPDKIEKKKNKKEIKKKKKEKIKPEKNPSLKELHNVKNVDSYFYWNESNISYDFDKTRGFNTYFKDVKKSFNNVILNMFKIQGIESWESVDFLNVMSHKEHEDISKQQLESVFFLNETLSNYLIVDKNWRYDANILTNVLYHPFANTRYKFIQSSSRHVTYFVISNLNDFPNEIFVSTDLSTESERQMFIKRFKEMLQGYFCAEITFNDGGFLFLQNLSNQGYISLDLTEKDLCVNSNQLFEFTQKMKLLENDSFVNIVERIFKINNKEAT